MHLESAKRHVRFVAELARERLLGRRRLAVDAVELAVLAEAREGGVGFGAVGALVPGRNV